MDRTERLIKKQIVILNRHVPRKRKTLKELLGEEKPHVIGADGSRHRFKTAELKFIASLLSEDEQERLRLPIYIEIDATISGARIKGKLEVKIVSEIIGREIDEYDIPDEIHIYNPEIKILRRELPTTTQYIFLVNNLGGIK
ncbi:hypothetical protein MTTB_04550 [Methanothermobacter tenebrarum]|uniref:UPF0216 protein MTTB_04550 n=1 Tax=Methanothermobacter tenebrarum TaxID=680118 RepID=A0ABM7YCV8_9EURY|nr:DUF61 family protein [Methanothermobacter tenebrarum]MDI6881922.1 DUF61 family protein [Methanothermobacter sp.]MDX9692726.1 DUF61 family protein [Methanothermobacter sp.]BDH79076.1 hypothetical protein MTTB_04550 [Methanothermobacter tenebrarum]HOQ20255.1 DUF61 family protein [Methanothermobacter sp.]